MGKGPPALASPTPCDDRRGASTRKQILPNALWKLLEDLCFLQPSEIQCLCTHQEILKHSYPLIKGANMRRRLRSEHKADWCNPLPGHVDLLPPAESASFLPFLPGLLPRLPPAHYQVLRSTRGERKPSQGQSQTCRLPCYDSFLLERTFLQRRFSRGRSRRTSGSWGHRGPGFACATKLQRKIPSLEAKMDVRTGATHSQLTLGWNLM